MDLTGWVHHKETDITSPSSQPPLARPDLASYHCDSGVACASITIYRSYPKLIIEYINKYLYFIQAKNQGYLENLKALVVGTLRGTNQGPHIFKHFM